MANGELQGWFADPFERHEQRYFSAGRATKLVRDGSAESYDEPPAATFEAAGAGALDSGYGQFADPGPSSPEPRSVRRFTIIYTASVLAVAAVVAIVLGHAAHARHQLAAAEVAFVARSAHRTLSERTADVALTGTVQTSGQTVTIAGTGQVDFSAGEEALNARFSVGREQVVEQEISTRGQFYYAISVNGTSFGKLTGGRNWVEVPISTSSAANLSGSDGRSALEMLGQNGATVRPLGTAVIGGATCTGYSVTPSRRAMTAAAQQEISALKVSPAIANAIRDIVLRTSPPTLTIWVDSRGLLRQLRTRIQFGIFGGAAASEVVETFSNYGAAVSFAPPPARHVITEQAFLRDFGHSLP
jgi:hypothetical protein